MGEQIQGGKEEHIPIGPKKPANTLSRQVGSAGMNLLCCISGRVKRMQRLTTHP